MVHNTTYNARWRNITKGDNPYIKYRHLGCVEVHTVNRSLIYQNGVTSFSNGWMISTCVAIFRSAPFGGFPSFLGEPKTYRILQLVAFTINPLTAAFRAVSWHGTSTHDPWVSVRWPRQRIYPQNNRPIDDHPQIDCLVVDRLLIPVL